jgi:hypothetical protein
MFAEIDPDMLWQTNERTHKVDFISNVHEVVELSERKAFHSMRQGAFETVIQFCDRFRATFRFCKEICPTISKSYKKQAVDFFD